METPGSFDLLINSDSKKSNSSEKSKDNSLLQDSDNLDETFKKNKRNKLSIDDIRKRIYNIRAKNDSIILLKKAITDLNAQILIKNNTLNKLNSINGMISIQSGSIKYYDEKILEDNIDEYNSIKKSIIKKQYMKIILEKIASKECNKKFVFNINANLVHRYIIVQYVYLNCKRAITFENVKLKISSITTFSQLKKNAIIYFELKKLDDYVLTDENYFIIYDENMAVNSFMKNYSVKSNFIKIIQKSLIKESFYTTSFQMKEINSKNLINNTNKIIINKNNLNYKTNLLSLKTKKFLKNFNGIKAFMMNNEDYEIIKNNKKKKCILNYTFFSVILTFLLLILTIFVISKNYLDVYSVYRKRTQYIELYNVVKQSPEIKELDQFFFHIMFFDLLFFDKKFAEFLGAQAEFYILSSTNYIINQVSEEKCLDKTIFKHLYEKNGIFGDVKCHSSKYNEKNAYKNDLVNNVSLYDEEFLQEIKHVEKLKKIEEQAKKFKTSKEAGIYFYGQYLLGKYNGDGYHIEIKHFQPDLTDKSYESVDHHFSMALYFYHSVFMYLQTFNDLFNMKRLRGVTELANGYSEGNSHIFWNIMRHTEFYPTGVVVVNEPQINYYNPSIYRIKIFFIIDIIRLITVSIEQPLYIYFLFRKYRYLCYKRVLSSPKTIFNLILLVLYLFIFISKLIYLNDDVKSYFDENCQSYKDSYKIAIAFRYIVHFEIVFFLIVTIKAFSFFKFINYLKIIYKSISNTVILYINLFVIVFITLIGFACLSKMTWSTSGNPSPEYSNIFLSLIGIFFYTSGYYPIGDKFSDVFGFILNIMVFIFQIFFFFAIFSSIFIESLRRSAIKYGYPEDKLVNIFKKKKENKN